MRHLVQVLGLGHHRAPRRAPGRAGGGQGRQGRRQLRVPGGTCALRRVAEPPRSRDSLPPSLSAPTTVGSSTTKPSSRRASRPTCTWSSASFWTSTASSRSTPSAREGSWRGTSSPMASPAPLPPAGTSLETGWGHPGRPSHCIPCVVNTCEQFGGVPAAAAGLRFGELQVLGEREHGQATGVQQRQRAGVRGRRGGGRRGRGSRRGAEKASSGGQRGGERGQTGGGGDGTSARDRRGRSGGEATEEAGIIGLYRVCDLYM